MIRTFRLYEKYQKYTRGAAKRRCKIALWTPGVRFKTRAVGFQVKVERFCALRLFCKKLLVPQYARSCFEPVKKGDVSSNAESDFAKIEVAVRA